MIHHFLGLDIQYLNIVILMHFMLLLLLLLLFVVDVEHITSNPNLKQFVVILLYICGTTS